MMMRITFVLGVLALSACQKDVSPMITEDDPCGAAGYEHLIGQNIAAVTMPQDTDIRVIGPDTGVTMDYVPERVNIYFDDNGIIARVSCG